jgi:uracil phosphoribosyltransferase
MFMRTAMRHGVPLIDESLDERAFIVPGLGDASDRAYGTK